MPMSRRLLRPRASGQSSFLLDRYSAAVAYSLRRLRTGHTGPAVQVRRSSDNAEDTFTPEQIANGALVAWVGAGDGFVKTWYDQAGNGQDVSQTTSTNQPRIVASGSLVTLNGKPCIDFDGSNDALLRSSSVTLSLHGPVFSVTKSDKLIDNQTIFRDGTAARTLHRLETNAFRTLSVTTPSNLDASTAVTPTNHLLLMSEFRSDGTTQYVNGSAGASSAITLSSISRTALEVGGRSGGEFFDGLIQELVILATGYAASMRQGIETNVNQHYGIF